VNPSTHSFPLSIGDRVSDASTGLVGRVIALTVGTGGTMSACVAFMNGAGQPQFEWIEVSRLRSAG
jgi:hypothetical protein